MKTQEIRDRYRNFFVERGHEAWPSDSLVPRQDPTLLFSSAGMVQFKPYFRGEMGDVLKRATTCQKCFRTSDIENVGHTERHHTFFEMLGNFSFGDYFKREAIRWAWEFSIAEMKLPREKIWVSIYEEDEESAHLWLEESEVPENRIIRLGKEDNFWPASGILGPSGPCSELYYDQGPGVGCGRPECMPGCDCDRYLEYWNLVFTQFDRQEDGSLRPLARKNIDTGLGLERLAAIMQGVHSNYETDVLHSLIRYLEDRTGCPFHTDPKKDVSLRVLADHIRAVTFVLSDQVMPANTGRGYVLRRIMRRALRHGLVLGIESDLLVPTMEVVAEINRQEYPEVWDHLHFTQRIAAAEEEAFRTTLNRGLVMLGEMIGELQKKNERILPGAKAFNLYDTYGFPCDLTDEILKERGLEGYHQEEFNQCMEEQRRRAQAAWRGSGETRVEVDVGVPPTRFTGYESLQEETTVLALFQKGKRVDSVVAGQEVEVVVDNTPFYAESGGQVGDGGEIEAAGGAVALVRIETTRKTASNVYVHFGMVEQGTLREGDAVRLTVQSDSRMPTMKNHTATHLLQAALRAVIGSHVKQAGSLVQPESLRFDFTHFEAMKPAELREVESRINRWIYENHPIRTEVTSLKAAQNRGAMAFFGEKYGEEVRMVEVVNVIDSSRPVSLELCGGTHVRFTGEIGCLRIVSEGSISAGNRRIEAFTGPRAVEFTLEEHDRLRALSSLMKVAPNDIPDRVGRLLEQVKELERDNKELRQKVLQGETADLLEGAETIQGVTVLTRALESISKDELQNAMDAVMDGAKRRVVVLAAVDPGGLSLVCAVSDDLTGVLNAGEIAKEISRITGGGGGGRKNRAQAGGKDASKLPEAFAKVRDIVQSKVQ